MFHHMHTHSEYSWDGVHPVSQLVRKAELCHMKALALTDHHTVMGWFDLEKETSRRFITPLYGVELNVNQHHITAIAMNQAGIQNLVWLNNAGYAKHSRPRISEKDLFHHSDGLLVLSGCSKGKLQHALYERNFQKAMSIAQQYKEQFPGRYAIEVQRSFSQPSNGHLHALVQVAKRNDLPIVPTNDVHYITKDDAHIQQFIMKSHTAGKVKSSSTSHYFKSSEEMGEFFPPDLLQNSERMAKHCIVSLTEYMQTTRGMDELPLAMVYRHDDKSALKKALFSRKEYRLGQALYKKMNQEDLKLEDIEGNDVVTQCVKEAYGIRGRVCEIVEDPYYYLKVNKEKFPYYRKNKDSNLVTQIDYHAAERMGCSIYDRRKHVVHFG